MITYTYKCLAIFLYALPMAFISSFCQAKPTKLNVLFIIADDLNTALSGYGHPQCKTPHLDALAETGVSFSKAYCQYPICGPSRASILSGQYPEKNKALNNSGNIKAGRVTLPLHFQNHGYWSCRVSKLYHMNVPGDILIGGDGGDHEPSWNERYNMWAMETYTPGKAENFTSPDSIKHYPELREKWASKQIKREEVRTLPGGHIWVAVETKNAKELPDNMAAEKAIDLLRKRAQDQKPFFLAVGFVRPHYPFVAPEKDFAAYQAKDMIIPNVPANDLEDIPKQAASRDLKVDDAAKKRIRRAYYASVTYMDRQVGRLLAELDQLDLRKNTIVVFLSDHGYLLGEHRAWQKHRLWEEAIRVPLIISAPGQKARGVTCDQYVELIDLYPTITELASLPPEPGTQGISLTELLDDPNKPFARQDAFCHTTMGYCLRKGKWAYMWYPPTKKIKKDGYMLYDMQKDPQQYNNLVNNPEYTKIKTQLHARLKKRIQEAKN